MPGKYCPLQSNTGARYGMRTVYMAHMTVIRAFSPTAMRPATRRVCTQSGKSCAEPTGRTCRNNPDTEVFTSSCNAGCLVISALPGHPCVEPVLIDRPAAGNVRNRKFPEIRADTSGPVMAGLKAQPRKIKVRCKTCRYFDICGEVIRVYVHRRQW